MNPELQQFVRDALSRGIPRGQIRESLAAARWRAEEIDAELDRWADGPAGLPVPRRRLSLSAREAFLHLVMFATLYTFAYNAGAVLYALIELRVPDPAFRGHGSFGLGALRGAIAGLLTAFPIYLWTSRLVGRSLVREPEKRSSGVRRWLTYLTLFIAVLTLIGNFANILTRLLAGEATARVVLQSLVVFVIAGLVFGHYLLGLRRDESEGAAEPPRPGVLGRIGAIATVLVLVAGLANVGSPSRSRGRTLDGRRIEALSGLAAQIESHAAREHRLPVSLDELKLDPRPDRWPATADPYTGEPYGFAVVDSVTYQLTATFDTADTLFEDHRPIAREWRHAAGPVTFTRRADLRRGS